MDVDAPPPQQAVVAPTPTVAENVGASLPVVAGGAEAAPAQLPVAVAPAGGATATFVPTSAPAVPTPAPTQPAAAAILTTTKSNEPVDAAGVAMVYAPYRVGAHNDPGYTKGWYCDGASPSPHTNRIIV